MTIDGEKSNYYNSALYKSSHMSWTIYLTWTAAYNQNL